MIQKNNVILSTGASLHRLFSAQAGIHLYSIAAQNALGHHQIHLLIIHSQHMDALTGERLTACGLGFFELVFSDHAV